MTRKFGTWSFGIIPAFVLAVLIAAGSNGQKNLSAQYDEEGFPSPPKPVKEEPVDTPIKKEVYLFGDFELPLEDFAPAHFTRFVGDKEISISDLISPAGVVLSADRVLGKDELALLKEKFGLKKERTLNSRLTLFGFTKHGLNLDQVLESINQMNTVRRAKDPDRIEFVTAASPIFLFSNDPRFLTGNIVIAWNEQVGEKDAEMFIGRLGLHKISFDPKTHIMVAAQTPKSGYNVFRLAQLFGPKNGNIYVHSVEPQYAALEIPLTVRSRIEPDDGKGQGGDIVGSAFRFILEIQTKASATVAVNELRTHADALKKWLPKSTQGEKKEVSPQAFDLDGPEYILASRQGDDGGSIITVVYRFRMVQSGEFSLAPPRVLYEFYDAQLKKQVSEKVDGAAVTFLSAGTMPQDAVMVNDAASMPDFSPQNPFSDASGWYVASAYCFAASALGILILGVWCAASWLAKHQVKQPSFQELANSAWVDRKTDLLREISDTPGLFWKKLAMHAREVLALVAYGDPDRFRAASHKDITVAFQDTWDAESLEKLKAVLETIFTLHFDANRQKTFSVTECLALVNQLETLILQKKKR